MRYIQMRLQVPDAFSEFLEENGENDDLIIESVVCGALLEVVGSIFVESISVQYFPEPEKATVEQSSIQCENMEQA